MQGLLFCLYYVTELFFCVVWCVSRRKLKKAIGTACIGSGQGIAVLLEAV